MVKSKILIVEGEVTAALEVESQLRSLGYVVTSIAETADKAIRKAEEEKPDIVIMDTQVRGEMDGIEAANAIQSRFSIPIVFSTPYIDDEKIELAKFPMPYGFILKPIQKRDLKISIEMALYVAKADNEQKCAEEALKESKELLKTTLEATADGILVVDSKGKVLLANERFAELWRIPKIILDMGDDDAMLQTVLSQLKYPNEFLTKVKFLYKSSVKDFDTLAFIDGRRIERVSLPLMKNAVVTGRVWSFRDVTGRKQAEKALQESEKKHRDLISNTPDILYRTDNEGKIVFMSPAVYKLSGYTVEETLGMNLANDFYVNPKDRKELLETIQKDGFVSGYESLLKHKDGSVWWTSTNAHLFKDSEGNVLGVEGVTRDITRQKQMEKLLRENESLFRSYFQLGNIGMAVTSPEKGWIHVNYRMSEILGLTQEEIKCTVWADLTHPDDLKEDVLQFEALLAGEINNYSMEKRYIHKNGSVIYTNLFVSCIRDDNGTVQHILTHIEDISERKKTEIELENYRFHLEDQVIERTKALKDVNNKLREEVTERKRMIKKLQNANLLAETANREKTEFLANMSHELRTPMQGIIGFTKLGIAKIHSSSKDKILEYLKNFIAVAKDY